METVYHYNDYKLLYKSSWMFLLTTVYALYNKHYMLSITPFVVAITSINHWRYPIISYRRIIDMIAVKSMTIYHTSVIYDAQYKFIYYNLLLIGTIIYIFGYYQYHYKCKKKISLYSHLLVHILANTGLIILYSGNITTIF
jgi:hypothetical protein